MSWKCELYFNKPSSITLLFVRICLTATKSKLWLHGVWDLSITWGSAELIYTSRVRGRHSGQSPETGSELAGRGKSPQSHRDLFMMKTGLRADFVQGLPGLTFFSFKQNSKFLNTLPCLSSLHHTQYTSHIHPRQQLKASCSPSSRISVCMRACVCVCVCKLWCACPSVSVEVRGHSPVLALAFHLVWDSLLLAAMCRPAGPQASRDTSVSTSHLSGGALGLQICTSLASFLWVIEILTPFLVPSRKVFYPLSHHSSSIRFLIYRAHVHKCVCSFSHTYETTSPSPIHKVLKTKFPAFLLQMKTPLLGISLLSADSYNYRWLTPCFPSG